MSESQRKYAQESAVQLFTYLREFIQQRSKVIRNLDVYEETIGFFEVPKVNGCSCIAWAPSGEDVDQTVRWIEIRKAKRYPPPELPKILEDWVDRSSLLNSAGEPRLLDSIIVKIEGEEGVLSQTIRIEDRTEIKSKFDDYISIKWNSWAQYDRQEKNLEDIYKRFFSIYQKHTKFGEEFELLVGFSLLKVRNDNQEIKRHLFTTPAAIKFNQKSGLLTVESAADGVKISLEQDMLEVSDRPIAKDITSIEDIIKECEDRLWDGVSLHQLGKAYAHAMPSGVGQYFETINEREYDISSRAQVIYSPYLILRKNSGRSLLKVYESLIERVSTDAIVPNGIQSLLGISLESTNDESSEGRNRFNSDLDDEVYFPLKSNWQQVAIAEKIRSHSAVLVQGPPGTGKSHTIANLICHLLAQGKRILITSHTSRALAVLKKKIPKEVSPLCVELVGSDHGSMRSLEESVSGILHRFDNWDSLESDRKILAFQDSLRRKRIEQAGIRTSLRELREKDVYHHSNLFGRYTGTLEAISKVVSLEKSKYGWFVDDLEFSLEFNSATLIDYLKLYGIAKDIPHDLENVNFDESLSFDYSSLEKLFVAEENLKSALGSGISAEPKIQVDGIKEEDLDRLSKTAENLKSLSSQLNSAIGHWHSQLLSDLVNNNAAIWHRRLSESQNIVSKLKRLQDGPSERVMGVNPSEIRDIRRLVDDLRLHFASGKSNGVWIFKSKVIKDAEARLRNIYVDDVPVVKFTRGSLDLLKKYLEVEILAEDFLSLWDGIVTFESNRLSFKFSQMEEMVAQAKIVFALVEELRQFESIIGDSLEVAGIGEVKMFIKDIHFVINKKNLQRIDGQISQLLDSVKDEHGAEIVNSLASKLKNEIRARDLKSIKSTLDEIKDQKHLKDDLICFRNIRNSLSRMVPNLLKDFESSPAEGYWPDRFEKIDEAISFRRTQAWIKMQNDSDRFKQLNLQYENISKEILNVIGDLASEMAWNACFSSAGRFGEKQRQSLNAWKQAVDKIGKGTGKYVNKYRRDAQHHMNACRPAIPAWIMPIHKVSEVMAVAPDVFDVVILDEASQSGPEAIFLQYLAKKIIVVGDDKQTSPDNTGLNRDGLHSLHQHLLDGIPKNIADSIGPDSSFFELGKIIFPKSEALREHFRCMPEIIQFSNSLCYHNTPLIPLKQFGANRLTPVVSAIYLRDGSVTGGSSKKVNFMEADAIVSAIDAMTKDVRYENKTIGVISLLGEWQAKEIEKRLIDRIGAEEIFKREIVCGDADAFQGDERDIMFLSLVVSVEEGRRNPALTHKRYLQRFNVAASRAKEQMFLYHSVTLNDLSTECVRYKLLDYCMSPKVEQTLLGDIRIDSLRQLSSSSERNVVSPPDPFDSWFEVDVFLQIQSNGYRVIPQYEVNGRRIDLVVEGLYGRVAVECDGDRWHGPDQYDKDMARQRDLERCGWVFFRIRGSEYYSTESDNALKGLWDLLAKMKIIPHESLKSLQIDSSQIVRASIISENSVGNIVSSSEVQKEDELDMRSADVMEGVTSSNIAQLLLGKGLDVRDKRSSGGALWVVDNGHLYALFEDLKRLGFDFTLTKKGSKTTNGMPGWYLATSSKRIKVSAENAVDVLNQREKYKFYLNEREVLVRSVDFSGTEKDWTVEVRSGPATMVLSPFDMEVSLMD